MAKKRRKIEFDRFGKCPICRKVFKSNDCPHSFDYVMKAVDSVNSYFDRDVAKLRRRK